MRLPRCAAGLALSVLSAHASAQTQEGPAKWLEDFEKRFPPVKKNAAAEELERFALALGIDPNFEGPADGHSSKEDLDGYRQAGFGSWLDGQLTASDDAISAPPPRLKGYLEQRQPILSRLVSLLEREVPEWGFDVREKPGGHSHLLVAVSTNRVLLSAALVAERSGRHVDAEQYLEAAWSLTRSLAERPDLISLLITVALEKSQVGVLRKMREPSMEWVERLSSNALQRQLLEALANNSPIAHVSSGELLGDDFPVWTRGWQAVADSLRGISPCQASKLSAEEIVRPLLEEWKNWKEAGAERVQEAQVISEIAGPNLANALRRVDRLLVDRELTARILELRQEKAASRAGRWPERFFDTESRICPGASYEYQARGAAMLIRFKGSIADPETPLVLPLSFEVRAPRATPTPTLTPRPKARPSRRS